MAVYNEEKSLPPLLQSIEILIEHLKTMGVSEVSVVIKEGASTDNSLQVLKELIKNKPHYSLISGPDRGKWSAIREALAVSNSDIYAVQDGDLEYDPMDLLNVLRPLINDECEVCFGSRFMNLGYAYPMKMINYLGNKLMSISAKIFSKKNVTDINTCYKAWKGKLTPPLYSDGFGGDVEIAMKLLRQPNIRYHEVPIKYEARIKGKKLRAMDGFMLWLRLFRFGLF